MVSIKNVIQKEIQTGDVVIIEYPSGYPMEEIVWGEVIPEISRENTVLIDDFFGIGDLMFRNYMRRLEPPEYRKIFKIVKNIKVVKIGPGRASYGKIVNEIPITYETQIFLDNYYLSINKIMKESTKPLYFVSIGVSEYIYFGKEKALQTLLTTRSFLPVEDWSSIYFLNRDMLPKEALAIMEDIASHIIEIKREGEPVLKKKIRR
ncbi:DUF257 family protein [Palaeococcus sp. (in: euryarchaeotes)]|uniref:DUF257 family protein n=1 Tax=Palaeococcus sp. (in: euryarchaeotes) TaxID=2820298 RepID=UPI0025FD5D73|nr:DUF257 family protein [Palaeococcus sp. (in: euryarchaeotes)]